MNEREMQSRQRHEASILGFCAERMIGPRAADRTLARALR